MTRSAGLLLLVMAATIVHPLTGPGPSNCCALGGDMACCKAEIASSSSDCVVRSCSGARADVLPAHTFVATLPTRSLTFQLTLGGIAPLADDPTFPFRSIDTLHPPPRG